MMVPRFNTKWDPSKSLKPSLVLSGIKVGVVASNLIGTRAQTKVPPGQESLHQGTKGSGYQGPRLSQYIPYQVIYTTLVPTFLTCPKLAPKEMKGFNTKPQ